MSEPIVVEQTTTAEASPDVVEVTITPAEQDARDAGWVSKEEWVASGRDPEEHRSAKEFVRVGELYKSLHQVKRENKQNQAALTALQRHHQYVFEKAHKQALSDLKSERRVALREGDEAYLEDVEKRIEDTQTEHHQARMALAATQAAVQDVGSAEFDVFIERNQWYMADQDLRDEADAIGFVYLNRGGNKAGLLKHVESKIKQKFPEKFGLKRGAPSPTANGDRSVRTSRNEMQLDEMETQIMKTLVTSGTMTEGEYKAELKKAKGIK